MSFVTTRNDGSIATVTLDRGKVNAIVGEVVDELRDQLRVLESDPEVSAVILTGAGKFFSFGFDIPSFLSFSKEAFTSFLENFTDLCAYLYLYPKPVVAALNGHTVAGGCMLAIGCDHRVMVSGNAKISLNEITFGASVFSGACEMLRFHVGSAAATRVLYSGAMYVAEDALEIGLIDEITTSDDLVAAATRAAEALARKPQPAFASIKRLLREPVIAPAREREPASIREFVEIWYSAPTWANLETIEIR